MLLEKVCSLDVQLPNIFIFANKTCLKEYFLITSKKIFPNKNLFIFDSTIDHLSIRPVSVLQLVNSIVCSSRFFMRFSMSEHVSVSDRRLFFNWLTSLCIFVSFKRRCAISISLLTTLSLVSLISTSRRIISLLIPEREEMTGSLNYKTNELNN